MPTIDTHPDDLESNDRPLARVPKLSHAAFNAVATAAVANGTITQAQAQPVARTLLRACQASLDYRSTGDLPLFIAFTATRLPLGELITIACLIAAATLDTPNFEGTLAHRALTSVLGSRPH